MEVGQVSVYIIVYLLPAATLFVLAALALVSNPANRDNQLVAAIPFLYTLLLFTEFIRHFLPIEASAIMVNLFFGNVGLVMLGICVHMYLQISRIYLHKNIPWYPYILYVIPVVLIIFNVFSGDTLTNSEEFTRQGIWIVPEYNAKYYGTMVGSVVLILISLYILTLGMRYEKSIQRARMLKFIRSGSVVTLVAMLFLGFFSFGSVLPPHSYIYVGLIFSMYLVIAIYKFNLTPSLATRYRTIFELNPNALVIFNERFEIKEINQAGKKNIERFGLVGEDVRVMLKQLQVEDQFMTFIKELQLTPQHHQTTISFEIEGQPVHMRVDGAMLMIDSNSHYAIIFRDMTKEIASTQLAKKLAYQDSLTSLANRTYFVSELEKAIVLEEPVGVLLIDLNQFKLINDHYGHLSGDEVLKAVATLLRDSFPSPHIAARLGGDEFVVLLRGISRQSQLEESIQFIREKSIGFNVLLGDKKVSVHYSVGGAYYQPDDTLDEMLMRADEQMYKEKYKDRPHERNSSN